MCVALSGVGVAEVALALYFRLLQLLAANYLSS